jgi:hypothetical protein
MQTTTHAERLPPTPLDIDDDHEPTVLTGAPIIGLTELDVWVDKYPAGAVTRLLGNES